MSYLFATGYVDKGGHAIVTTQKQAEECSGAYVTGEADADDGQPCRPLYHFSDLGCIESYIIGYKAATATLAKLPPLQDFIDAGAALDADVPPTRDERSDEAGHQADTEAFFRFAKREASDLEDDMADREFWARGC